MLEITRILVLATTGGLHCWNSIDFYFFGPTEPPSGSLVSSTVGPWLRLTGNCPPPPVTRSLSTCILSGSSSASPLASGMDSSRLWAAQRTDKFRFLAPTQRTLRQMRLTPCCQSTGCSQTVKWLDNLWITNDLGTLPRNLLSHNRVISETCSFDGIMAIQTPTWDLLAGVNSHLGWYLGNIKQLCNSKLHN